MIHRNATPPSNAQTASVILPPGSNPGDVELSALLKLQTIERRNPTGEIWVMPWDKTVQVWIEVEDGR